MAQHKNHIHESIKEWNQCRETTWHNKIFIHKNDLRVESPPPPANHITPIEINTITKYISTTTITIKITITITKTSTSCIIDTIKKKQVQQRHPYQPIVTHTEMLTMSIPTGESQSWITAEISASVSSSTSSTMGGRSSRNSFRRGFTTCRWCILPPATRFALRRPFRPDSRESGMRFEVSVEVGEDTILAALALRLAAAAAADVEGAADAEV